MTIIGDCRNKRRRSRQREEQKYLRPIQVHKVQFILLRKHRESENVRKMFHSICFRFVVQPKWCIASCNNNTRAPSTHWLGMSLNNTRSNIFPSFNLPPSRKNAVLPRLSLPTHSANLPRKGRRHVTPGRREILLLFRSTRRTRTDHHAWGARRSP